MDHTILHLGSNLGDRQAILNKALESIADRIGIIDSASSIYETKAWGKEDQDNFYNMALGVKSTLAHDRLIALTQMIEKEAGPSKKERWGPRHLDIDIIYIADKKIETEDLHVPHPRLHERNFVLIPLLEIYPAFMHPTLKKRTVDLFLSCEDTSDVWKINNG